MKQPIINWEDDVAKFEPCRPWSVVDTTRTLNYRQWQPAMTATFIFKSKYFFPSVTNFWLYNSEEKKFWILLLVLKNHFILFDTESIIDLKLVSNAYERTEQ